MIKFVNALPKKENMMSDYMVVKSSSAKTYGEYSVLCISLDDLFSNYSENMVLLNHQVLCKLLFTKDLNHQRINKVNDDINNARYYFDNGIKISDKISSFSSSATEEQLTLSNDVYEINGDTINKITSINKNVLYIGTSCPIPDDLSIYYVFKYWY